MQPKSTKVNGKINSDYMEGVTIEGEGEYQIMEVDDVEEEEKPTTSTKQAKLSKAVEKPTVKVLTTKLTREEERALALEQMELLKATLNTRKSTRKNDKQSKELVSKLKAEWTDDEEESAKLENGDESEANAAKKKETIVKLRPISRRRPVTIPPGLGLQELQSNANDLLAGGKKRRVIKRRIIWDPHVPETHFNSKMSASLSAVSNEKQQPTVEKKILQEFSPSKNTRAAPKTTTKLNTRASPKAAETKIAVNKIPAIKSTQVKINQTKLLNKIKDETVEADSSPWDDVYNESTVKALIVRSHSNSSFSSVEANTETEKKEHANDKAKIRKIITTTTTTANKIPATSQGKIIKRESLENQVEIATNTFAMPTINKKRAKVAWLKLESGEQEDSLLDKNDMRTNWLRGNVQDFEKSVSDDTIFYERTYKNQIFVCIDYNNNLDANHPRNCTMRPKAINKLSDIIIAYSNNKDLRSLVLWSRAKNFICGIDYIGLIHQDEKARRYYADDLGTALHNLFMALACCAKPLIVGINGNVQGFGLTMLPLFDLVIAKHDTELRSLHSHIGQLPEGYCFWAHSNQINDFVRKRLFYFDDVVHAHDILAGGVVHKICKQNWPQEITSAVNHIMRTLPSVFSIMKKNQLDSQMEILSKYLDKELDKTTKQWIKNVCFENLTNIEQHGYKTHSKECLDYISMGK